MKRFYQQEWHGIPFRDVAPMSSSDLAGAPFYAAFYRRFFERYANPEQLDPEWLQVKQQSLDFIAGHPAMSRERAVLSLGCGLGLIEKRLLERGYRDLEINEVSPEPLRWVLPHFDPSRVHVGFFPACVPADRTYDTILLVGIDGVFDQASLIELLQAVRARLRPGGTAILLSWNHHVERVGIGALVDRAKDVVKVALDRLGVRPLGQFWGYTRSPGEIRQAVQAAGFAAIEEGMLEQRTRFPTYWVTGRAA